MTERKVKKILLGVPQTAGDVIIATGLLPLLKQKWPDANIYFATERRFQSLLKGNPYIKRVLEWHKSMYEYRNYETWGPQINTFDIVFTPTIVTQVCPHWIHGGHGEYMGDVYRHECHLDEPYGEQYLKIEEPDFKDDLPEKFITVHTQTTQDPKNYDFIQEVADRIKDIPIVQVGGNDDMELKGVDLDLRGRTSWQSLAYVFGKSKLHIGLDSAPMHVCTFMNTPSIILFGGTYAKQGVQPAKSDLITVLEPDDRYLCATSCHLVSCTMKERGLDKCINNISVDTVLRTIEVRLGEGSVEYQDPVKISAYMILRNGIKYGFPFQKSIEAAAAACDEVVVIDGGSDDGTLESLELLKRREPKLKVFKTKWDVEGNPTLFGDEKTHARRFCQNDFLLQFDADEILHEPYPGALREMVAKHRDYDVLCFPVINFYGDDETIRVEPVSWKWRVSKNNPNIVHGVHGDARRTDESGKLVMDKRISDGCEYIYADNFQVCKRKPIFDLAYEIKHQEVIALREKPEEFEKAKQKYADHIKEKVLPNECLVFHYSWHDLERKKDNGKFWDKTWHGQRKATHNRTEDIEERLEKANDILVKVDFDHPLKEALPASEEDE